MGKVKVTLLRSLQTAAGEIIPEGSLLFAGELPEGVIASHVRQAVDENKALVEADEDEA